MDFCLSHVHSFVWDLTSILRKPCPVERQPDCPHAQRKSAIKMRVFREARFLSLRMT